MALDKAKKKKIIAELLEKIKKQKAIFFVDLSGLKTKEISDLRKKLKAKESELKVAKKTLTRIVFEKEKLKVDFKKLLGEIALVFAYGDEILPAKILYQFSKDNPNLKILGGFFEKRFHQPEEIIHLAQLPSKEELMARIVASLSSPLSNLLNVLKGNLKKLVFLLPKITPHQP